MVLIRFVKKSIRMGVYGSVDVSADSAAAVNSSNSGSGSDDLDKI